MLFFHFALFSFCLIQCYFNIHKNALQNSIEQQEFVLNKFTTIYNYISHINTYNFQIYLTSLIYTGPRILQTLKPHKISDKTLQTMNNEDYMTPKSRNNNLIQIAKLSPTQPIHIFTKPSVLSPPISALKNQCQKMGIPFTIHQNPRELSTLINNQKQKAFAVIQTPRQSSTQLFSHVFPQTFSFPKKTQNVKVITYPGILTNANYQSGKDKYEVMQMYEKYIKNGQSSKIKLRKVHSSKDVKYQLASPQTIKNNKKGKQVLFQKLLYNDFNVNQNSQYSTLIEAIKDAPNVYYSRKHQHVKQAIDSMSSKNNKILVLLDEDNWMGYKTFIQKSKIKDKVNLMIFGEFKHPRKQLVEENVYFASTHGIQIIDQLSKLGFSKMFQCRSLYTTLSSDKRNRFRFSEQQQQQPPQGNVEPFMNNNIPSIANIGYANPIKLSDKPQLHRLSQRSGASIFSNVSSQQERFERNWTVDIDPNAKNRANAEYNIYEQGKKQISPPQDLMNVRASRITGRRSSQSQSQRYASQHLVVNNLVDEKGRVRHKQSDVNIFLPQPQSQFIKLHNSHKKLSSPSKQNTITTQTQGSKKIISITKKSATNSQQQINSRHQTKHQQLPSNVIQQMSDQYRGSNKESIMHLDDHYYHSATKQASNGALNSAGSIGGQYNQSGGFSKFKNVVTQPAEQLGYKRVVHNEQMVPAQTYKSSTKELPNNIQSHRQTDLPIYSPTDSELVTHQQSYLIDGLTGQLIGGPDIKNQKIISKNNYQTLTVNDYNNSNQAIFNKGNAKPIDNIFATLFAGGAKQNNLQNSGGWQTEQNSKSKTIVNPSIPNQSQSQSNPNIRLGYEYADKSKFGKQDPLASRNYEYAASSNKSIQTPYNINGLNGQFDHESSQRLNDKKSTVHVSNTASYQTKQNILRPSHYIEPQVVKILSSNTSVNEFNSRNSIATQKKITTTNQNYNIVNGKNIQSTTSIRVPLNNQTTNHERNQTTYNVVYNSIPQSHNQAQNPNHNQRIYQTSNYEPVERRYVSPSNYSASTNVNNTNNSYTTTYNRETGSSPNYKVYTAEQYKSRYETTNRNQPEVINRVYIKASQLPDRTNDVTNRRYNETTNMSPSYNNTRQDYKVKLSVQDLDPFNQRSASRNSSMKKGSYMDRKQTGKRDPFSPYDQNGSSRIQRQKSGVKVYSSDQYQKINDARRVTSPGRQVTTSTTTTTVTGGIDLNKYQKVIENGVAIYRQKLSSIPANSSTSSYERIINQKTSEPSRQNYHTSTNKVTVVNGYQQGGITRYQPSGRQYANSPTRREGSSYQRAITQENPLRRPAHQQHRVVPMKSQSERVQPLVYDSRSPMKVAQYRTDQTYSYQSPTKHVVQVHRQNQPRVQASNFNTRIDNHNEDRRIFTEPNKIVDNSIGIISGIQHRNSQIFELSDGSIMRRNNIKFGINKYRTSQAHNQKIEDSYEYLEEMKSKIKSKIINMSQINRNYLIEKKIINEQQITNEKQAYSYINTSVNEFRFLIDEELNYLHTWLTKYLKTKNDSLEHFRGIEQMYQKLQSGNQQEDFDITFVFVKKQDIKKINKKLVSENCYVVEIMSEDYKGLQITQKQKRIRLSKLPLLKLAEKIIIQANINHIILYQKQKTGQNNNSFEKQVNHLLSLFPQGQFVKQFYEDPLNLQLIEGLIDDDPKFIRLYIICNQKQMINVAKQLNKIDPYQSSFPKDICKIICIPTDNQILKYQESIEEYPNVAWMTNASKIQDYKSLIKYALRQDQQQNINTASNKNLKQNTPIEQQEKQKIYFHSRHRNFPQMIEKQFPARFEFEMFNSLTQTEKKIIKLRGDKLKDSNSLKKDGKKVVSSGANTLTTLNTTNYLVLHPVLSEQYVDIKLWKKVYMLGKSDKIQRKVIKIGGVEQLIQMLRK